ncbi:MAG: 3-hydroxyacyl-ACP dehydratase FabZ [Deltaproteobacteria bacterium]|nr:3-hydroxyacyl-ACP dehydratase FabZ [Deltaproteobacteria bacterium]
MFEISEIMGFLPHRFPFLMVDRILEAEPGKRIVGIKNVTINEPYFQGHFPGHPIVPGVLLVEAMAQVAAVLVFLTEGERVNVEEKVSYFMGIDKVKFRKPVVPGDQVRFELEVTRHRGSIWAFKGRAFVEEKLVMEGELLATFVDRRQPASLIGEGSEG